MSAIEFLRQTRASFIDRLGEEQGVEAFETFRTKFEKSSAQSRKRNEEYRLAREKKKIKLISVEEASVATANLRNLASKK